MRVFFFFFDLQEKDEFEKAICFLRGSKIVLSESKKQSETEVVYVVSWFSFSFSFFP